MNGAKTKAVCFKQEIVEIKATTPDTVSHSSSSEDDVCSSESKQDRRVVLRPMLLVLMIKLDK
jgi:hypothetical protein